MANIRVYPYLSPRIVEVLSPSTEVTIQELVDLIRDWEDSEDGMPFDFIISAAGKEDLGGGVTVGITATLNNAQIMFTGRTTPLDDGTGRTCDATDNNGIQLYVDDADFITDNIMRGDIVYNMTTKEMAVILEVVDQYTINHFQLSGSGIGTWTSGDEYMIYHNAQCNISGGNLVAINEFGSNITPVLASPLTQVVRTSSSSATLQELSSIQFSSYNNGVTIDIANLTGKAVSGTLFPIGTRQAPCNNLIDAHAIATDIGVDTFYIIGDITLDNPNLNLEGHVFIGESTGKTNIIVDTLADVYKCEFKECTINGVLDGNSYIENCIINDLTYVNGTISSSILVGTIILGGGVIAHISDCKSGISDTNFPVIDMGGSGQSLSLRNYNGGITITNKTGIENVSIDLNSGHIKITDTVLDGTIVCRGIGQIVEDLSKNTMVFDSLNDMSGLIKPPGGLPRINLT